MVIILMEAVQEVFIEIKLLMLGVWGIKMRLACMICTEMFGSGAVIGTVPITVMQKIPRDRRQARIACTVAAAGSTAPGAAVLLIGAATAPIVATATSDSASLLSQFSDRLSLQQQASPIRSGTDARCRGYKKNSRLLGGATN